MQWHIAKYSIRICINNRPD